MDVKVAQCGFFGSSLEGAPRCHLSCWLIPVMEGLHDECENTGSFAKNSRGYYSFLPLLTKPETMHRRSRGDIMMPYVKSKRTARYANVPIKSLNIPLLYVGISCRKRLLRWVYGVTFDHPNLTIGNTSLAKLLACSISKTSGMLS